jgi:magnesium chelatase accessory protein
VRLARPDWQVEGPTWPHRQYSRFVQRHGMRWHVQVMGSGPVALLVHGTAASTHSFRELMPLLATRFTVVAADLPGHAFTAAPTRFAPTPSGIAAALGDLLDHLQLSPTLAVGHSAGAAVIVRMTLDRAIAPELLVGLGAALVPFRGAAASLFGPAARLLSQSQLAARLISLRARDLTGMDRLVRGTGSALDRPGVELYRRLAHSPGHIASVLAMMASWNLDALYDALGGLRVPLLLLAGERDRAIPLSQLREVAARVPAARLVVVDGTGHLLHEEQPAVVARLILEAVDAAPRIAEHRR